MFKTPIQPFHQLIEPGFFLSVPPCQHGLPLAAIEFQHLLNYSSYLMQVHFACGLAVQPCGVYAQPQQQLQSYRQFIRVWCGNGGHFVLLHTIESSPTSLVPDSVPNKPDFWSELIVGRIQ